MTRTLLKDRTLPNYTRAEEIANMVTHIIGGIFGITMLITVILKYTNGSNVWSLAGGCIYAASMICLYSVSSIYHGLRPCYAKKVMQVVDHCTIYFLIAGTYSAVLLIAMRPVYPVLSWAIFSAEWGLAAFAAVFTAIDHNRYGKLSMSCYIGMGWLIVLALKPTLEVLGPEGFLWLLSGGIAYTLGAALYGLGRKSPMLHTVFHVFVDLGSVLQAVCILNIL